MSHRAMTWAVDQRTGSPARKAVLMNLADRADAVWSCWPGQKLIAKDTELGERTVRRALDDLEEAGIIRRDHRRRKDGSWSSDRYVLAGVDHDPDAQRLLADADTSGHSGRRSQRPQAAATADPAATAAGHKPPVTNPHSLPPSEGERAPADADADPREDGPQLVLVDAPAKPAKGKARPGLTDDWRPSERALAKTAEVAPWLDVEAELVKFRNSHIGRQTKWVDYDRAWHNWVAGCHPPQQRRSSRPGPYRNPQTQLDQQGQDSARAAWESWGRPTGGTDR